MSAQSATYSFQSTSGAMSNPLLLGAPIVFAGEIGIGSIMVEMLGEQSAQDIAADNTVMPSAVAGGDHAAIIIEAQQTSIIHQEFLALYNLLKIARDAGDATNWAATNLSLLNTVTKLQQVCTGLMFTKIPNFPYQAQGQRIQWRFLACSVSQF